MCLDHVAKPALCERHLSREHLVLRVEWDHQFKDMCHSERALAAKRPKREKNLVMAMINSPGRRDGLRRVRFGRSRCGPNL